VVGENRFVRRNFAPAKRRSLVVVAALLVSPPLALADEGGDAFSATGLFLGKGPSSSVSGRPFFSFLGIPYAAPPVGPLRFKPPVPFENYDSPTKALKEGNICLQDDSLADFDEIRGSEDCLYLNIHTPQVNGSLPVMVWIHGGSWKFGSGSSEWYGPEPLMDRDVVLVTFNYRLGPLGFSSLENEHHPGNLGLKDQAMAIKWVSDNIEEFGGDPQKITIFGQSVGAVAVQYHMTHPETKKLLFAGISMSGSMLSAWAFAPPGAVKEKTVRLAKSLNCTSKDDREIMECLRNVDAKAIVEATRKFDLLEQQLLPFRPVLEGEGGYVAQDPWKITPSDLPWLTGFTSSESGFMAVFLTQGDAQLLRLFTILFEHMAPTVLMYSDTTTQSEMVTKAIKEFYFPDNSLSPSNIRPILNLLSDAWVNYPSYAAMKRHNGTVYSYYYDHKGEYNVVQAMGSSDDFGVTHGDDLGYIFNIGRLKIQDRGSERDKEISKEMVNMWADFATTGKPSDSWKPYSEGNGFYHIKTEGFKMIPEVIPERMKFWETIPYRDVQVELRK